MFRSLFNALLWRNPGVEKWGADSQKRLREVIDGYEEIISYREAEIERYREHLSLLQRATR